MIDERGRYFDRRDGESERSHILIDEREREREREMEIYRERACSRGRSVTWSTSWFVPRPSSVPRLSSLRERLEFRDRLASERETQNRRLRAAAGQRGVPHGSSRVPNPVSRIPTRIPNPNRNGRLRAAAGERGLSHGSSRDHLALIL